MKPPAGCVQSLVNTGASAAAARAGTADVCAEAEPTVVPTLTREATTPHAINAAVARERRYMAILPLAVPAPKHSDHDGILRFRCRT